MKNSKYVNITFRLHVDTINHIKKMAAEYSRDIRIPVAQSKIVELAIDQMRELTVEEIITGKYNPR